MLYSSSVPTLEIDRSDLSAMEHHVNLCQTIKVVPCSTGDGPLSH